MTKRLAKTKLKTEGLKSMQQLVLSFPNICKTMSLCKWIDKSNK